MQGKKLGVTAFVFEIRKAKGHFEGKLLRLCWQFKSRNINLSLVSSICKMTFKYVKSESVKLPETQIFKNCIEAC